MRGWLEPVGDAPANAYWFRRGLVLLAAIVLVVAIPWLTGRLGGAPKDTATGLPSTVPPASAGASGQSSGTTPNGTDAAGQSPDSPGQPCRVGALRVAIEGTNPLPVAEAVDFTITVATSQTGCTLDLAQLPVTVSVASGADLVWSTANCPQWQPAGSFELGIQRPATFRVTWPNRRGSGCELSEIPPGAGTYVATLDVSGLTAQYVFQIA